MPRREAGPVRCVMARKPRDSESGDGVVGADIDPVMTDDARDLELARGQPPGSHEAFARIYDRHAPVVRALCRRHSVSEAETDDALQETFIRAFRMLDRVDNPDGLRSWLYQIGTLVCSERRRAATRRRKHELGAGNGQPARGGGRMSAITMNHEPAPNAAAEHAEQLERLTAALDTLPDEERLAIHLYYLEPDPVAAAGSAIGCSRSAYYKLLARARERLGSIMTRANA